MAQAESASTTRRDFLRSTAAGIAAGTSLAVVPVAAVADPIFLAIDRVRTAEAGAETTCDEVAKLERLLPSKKRRSNNLGGGVNIDPNDDPRWVASVQRYRVVFDEVDAASLRLLDVRPTTVAGIIALLRYAHQYVTGGREWPQQILEDGQTDEEFGLDFSVVLHKHVADALEVLVAAGDL